MAIDRFILWATRRTWNRLASRILCQACETGVIDSRQMHLLAREFDPTQRAGLVGRLPAEPVCTAFLLERGWPPLPRPLPPPPAPPSHHGSDSRKPEPVPLAARCRSCDFPLYSPAGSHCARQSEHAI